MPAGGPSTDVPFAGAPFADTPLVAGPFAAALFGGAPFDGAPLVAGPFADTPFDGEGANGSATWSTAGRWTRKVVDQPGVSTISMVPLWASATDRAMARPRPEPGIPCSAVEARR